jgi:proteasome lid subunit RPN8/RPN11
VVVPAAIRAELAEHARAEEPNEACGLIVFRDDVAVRYEPGINETASPYRFEIRMPDPEVWYLEDEGYELAVFHSHVSSPPRPSRTDVQNIGLWRGKPYFIYSLRSDELTAWRISNGSIEALPLRTPATGEE